MSWHQASSISDPASVGAGEPATRAQAAIFFDDQREPANGAYNVSTVLTVTGPLVMQQVVHGCRVLASLTPAIRARFGLAEETGEVVQWFSPAPPEVEWVDPDGRAAGVSAGLARAVGRPFEADGGPLARFAAVRVSPMRTVIAAVTHHLIVDGASQLILARRLASILSGQFPARHDTDTYSALVRRVRAAEDTAWRRDHDHWAERLRALPEPPVRSSGEDVPPENHVGGNLRAVLAGASVEHIDRLASERGVSPFYVLIAAVYCGLARHGGLPNVLSTAASTRPTDFVPRDVVGCFVNQVPLVAPGEPAVSLTETVRRHGHAWWSDLQRRQFPFLALAQQYRELHGAAQRLDAVSVSYRQERPTTEWDSGDLHFAADVFRPYPQASTELSIRMFRYASQLEVEIATGQRVSPGVGESLIEHLRYEFER